MIAPFGIVRPRDRAQSRRSIGLSWRQDVGSCASVGFINYPGAIFNLPHGTLRTGAIADVTISISLASVLTLRVSFKSRNTPFTGWQLRGARWLRLSLAGSFYNMRETE